MSSAREQSCNCHTTGYMQSIKNSSKIVLTLYPFNVHRKIQCIYSVDRSVSESLAAQRIGALRIDTVSNGFEALRIDKNRIYMLLFAQNKFRLF